MNRLVMVPVILLVLSSTAFADDPEHDLPGQAQEPAQEPSPGWISPDVDGGPDVADLSPGDHAPEFKLESSTGSPVQLSDLKGHLSVLVFGTDCAVFGPFAAENDSVRALGVRQYGICPNTKRAIVTYAERQKVAFPLLSDPDARVSQRFGMYDTDNQAIQPGIVLVDEKGVIRMIVQGPAPHPEGVLLLVRRAIQGS